MRSLIATFFGLALILPIISDDSSAQRRYFQLSTGTGFFVSVNGDIVTNHHVLQNCKPGTIQVRNDLLGDWISAEHKASDSGVDLALLRAGSRATRVAALEAQISSVRVGSSAVVIGFPGQRAQTGEYKFIRSEVTNLQGPQGEPKWIQFTDVVAKGNSGGPLLDGSGQVIGVVTGRSEMFRIDQQNGSETFIGSSGVAVSLPYLKNFLKKNRVLSRNISNWGERNDRFLEHQARDFIVSIKCVTAESDRPFAMVQ